MHRLVPFALIAAAIAACGGDDGNQVVPDAPPRSDARPSTVMVIACAGETPVMTITTSGMNFTPDLVTITAGDVIRFMPAGFHNMTSGTPTAPTNDFVTTNGAEACLKFTAPDTFPFFCSVHPTYMDGVITVN